MGARDTPPLDHVTWVGRKAAIADSCTPRVAGAENIRGDFLSYAPPGRFDLDFCLQVLEHPDDPARFLRKVLRTGRVAVTLAGARPFAAADLLPDGKPLYSRSWYGDEAAYRDVEAVLGRAWPGWHHGLTPYLWCKPAVASLTGLLSDRSSCHRSARRRCEVAARQARRR